MEDHKREELRAFLSRVRDRNLEQLVTAVELDRMDGGDVLPHETMLDAMRPALREKTDYERVPTPERLFCVAFEDLLYSRSGRGKQNGRIGRESIKPMWKWLKEDLLKKELPVIEDEISSLITDNKMDEARDLARELQKAAGPIMLSRLADIVHSDEEFEKLCDKFGGASAVGDLHDIGSCLEVADLIGDIQDQFASSLPGFSDSDYSIFHDIYKRFRDESSGHSQLAFLVLMGRMMRPWEIVPFMVALEEDFGEFEIAKVDQMAVSDLLLDDIDLVGAALVNLRAEDVDIGQLLKNLNMFVQITGGVLRGAELNGDAEWEYRFKIAREGVGKKMGILVEAMPGIIFRVLPVKPNGGFGDNVARVPDTSIIPTPQEVVLSVELTKLFTDLQFYANHTGFSSAWSRAALEFEHDYDRFRKDIAEYIRTSSGTERENGELFAEVLAQIGHEYHGPGEAEMIRTEAAEAAQDTADVRNEASG